MWITAVVVFRMERISPKILLTYSRTAVLRITIPYTGIAVIALEAVYHAPRIPTTTIFHHAAIVAMEVMGFLVIKIVAFMDFC
jgi:hypothetical protein